MKGGAKNERTARDGERVRRAQQKVSSRFHTRVVGNCLNRTAVRAHHDARIVEQAGHQTTSSAPSLTLTSESLISILFPPRSTVRPESSRLTLSSLESLSVITGASSSKNNLCSLVKMTLTAAPASDGTSSLRQ